MRLAIAMVFLSATVVQGSKDTTLLPWKLYEATPFEVGFVFLLNSGHEVIMNKDIICPPACFFGLDV